MTFHEITEQNAKSLFFSLVSGQQIDIPASEVKDWLMDASEECLEHYNGETEECWSDWVEMLNGDGYFFEGQDEDKDEEFEEETDEDDE
jgi:hypothetical protein